MWVRHAGLTPWLQANHIALGLAYGIGHLHAHACLHSDLSTKNDLLSPGSQPTLLEAQISDFGGAGSCDASGLCNDSSLGTEYIRPPERWLRANKWTAAGDLWSYGVITLALASGTIWGAPDFTARVGD